MIPCRLLAAFALIVSVISPLQSDPPSAVDKRAADMKITALAAFAPKALAQPFGTATITNVTVGNGTISASGIYTVQNGWSTTGITSLFRYMQTNAQNQAAGQLGHTVKAAAAPKCGTWGPLNITNLPLGSYAVVLVMQIKNGCGACAKFDTFTSNIMGNAAVTKQGGAPAVPAANITWGGASPQVGPLKVMGGGGYQITGGASWSPTGCSLSALPTAGGEASGTQVAGNKPACGNWGAITVNVLAPGSYYIIGAVSLDQTVCGQIKASQIVYSPATAVNIPPKNCGCCRGSDWYDRDAVAICLSFPHHQLLHCLDPRPDAILPAPSKLANRRTTFRTIS